MSDEWEAWVCHRCGRELIAPWQKCPGCGAEMADDKGRTEDLNRHLVRILTEDADLLERLRKDDR